MLIRVNNTPAEAMEEKTASKQTGGDGTEFEYSKYKVWNCFMKCVFIPHFYTSIIFSYLNDLLLWHINSTWSVMVEQ